MAPLRIKQVVIRVRQLADDFLVANDIVFPVFLKLVIVCGITFFWLPLAECDDSLPLLIRVLFEIQLEDPVALQIIGALAFAVSLRVVGLQEVVGAERQLTEINHACGERIVILVLEFVGVVRRYDRIRIGQPVTAPAHKLGITVVIGLGLTVAAEDRGIDRKGRARECFLIAVHLHKAGLEVVADVFNAHIGAADIGAQHRLVILIQREDAVVSACIDRITRNQCLGVRHIERPAGLP